MTAAPFWEQYKRQDRSRGQKKTHLSPYDLSESSDHRSDFPSSSGYTGGLMALNDRLKLRSMVVGEKDDRVFIASEESAIRAMERDAENIWAPGGGEPVIIEVKDGAY